MTKHRLEKFQKNIEVLIMIISFKALQYIPVNH